MRRLVALTIVLASIALPASAAAQAPGFREVALPATLQDIVFASDGTIYGTVDNNDIYPSRNPGVVWRSRDHGHTWSAAYQWPIGWRIQLLQVSPIEPTTVYASVAPPGSEATTVTRIDTRAGIATPLSIGGWTGKGDWHSSLPRPHSSWSGMDAAGTAYALDMLDNKAMLVRCRERRDTCDRVPILFAGGGEISFLSVDPNAAGVLVATNRRADGLGTFLEASVDGGASWTQGVAVPGGNVIFAGPGVRTLYQFQPGLSGSPGTVFVSHDAGLTWYSQYPAPKGSLIVGSRPSVGIGLGPGPLIAIGDDGVSGQVGTTPIASWPVVDPADSSRIFMLGSSEAFLSEDRGSTWHELAGTQFGVTSLEAGNASGSGRYLYAAAQGVIWYSHDAGETWAKSERPPGESDRQPIVSRDDPRVAYASSSVPVDNANGLIRTLDGGVTWQTVVASTTSTVPVVTWIEPGAPLHVYSYRGNSIQESVDGGVTWLDSPQADWCGFEVNDDAASPTGRRLRCDGFWTVTDPLRPLPSPPPYAPGLVASPDAPGNYAIALPANNSFNHQPLLGALAPDWSWSSLLAPTGAYGPATATSDAVDAWPAPGGTVFYAWDAKAQSTWVRRGSGRWWRLRVDGRDMAVLATLDATHALVGTPGQFGERGVVDLALPPVAAPLVQPAHGELTCVVPWDAADAVASTPTWLRDGSVIAGAVGADYAPVAADAGHALACRVTATTDFGSSTVTSAPYAPPQSAAAGAKLSLTGTARVGRTLRCGASLRLTWFRDGKAVKGRHTRTFTVGARDRGHTLACQTRRADGTVARSRAALVRA